MEKKLPNKEDIGYEKEPETTADIDKFKCTVMTTPAAKESTDVKATKAPVSSKKKNAKKKTKGFFLSEVNLTEPQTDSDKEKHDVEVVKAKKTPEKKLRDKNVDHAKTDLKTFSQDDELLTLETKERNNFFKLLILLYRTGLDTLRKLFLDIHPSWTYKPDDAKNLDKGKMKLQSHEQALFDTGDINKFDVSLITTVLLYSKKCHKAIMKKTGFEKAIRSIKDRKNQLVSHTNSERLTDSDFHAAWEVLSQSLQKIGASSQQVEQIFTDDIVESAKFYRDRLLEEVARSSAVESQVNTIQTTLQDVYSEVKDISAKVSDLSLSNQAGAPKEQKPHLEDLSGPNFTEWLQFCEHVDNFDCDKSNYMLITDALPPECLEHFSVLRSVPWKVVLDFNPASEEHGMYHDFTQKEGKNSLFDMITPAEIRKQHANLARNIDPQKTKWLFVKGREKDNQEGDEVQTFQDWKSSSVKHITYFFNCCSHPGKLDSQKPLICLILPFQEQSVPFLELALDRLCESFDEFTLSFVAIKHEFLPKLQSKFDIFATDLSSSKISSGLEDLLRISTEKVYRLPMFEANLSAKLSCDHFLYLEQYLEVLYDGCEEIPTDFDDESMLDKFFDKHRESFLSGNWISFVSLHEEHDAKREVGEEVRNYIQRLLEQRPTHSTIVEIRHSPGTGGTTIARRVLWDLHKSYPCAIARLDNCTHDFEEDAHFIDDLADRICDIHETCETFPLILLDGKHPRMEAFSNKLVRVLNCRGHRAVLLRCLHRSKQQRYPVTQQETNISDVNRQFTVQVRLEDSRKDLNRFKEKYREYIDEFKVSTNQKLSFSRVFHFPLIAMLKGLEGFNSKLKLIITESFDEMDGLQKEVAALVAFIQLFAAQETPAFLLYKAFIKDNHDRRITYEEINHELITEQLLNLMIPMVPSKQVSSQGSPSRVPEKYTFQHPLVADLVLKRYYATQKRDVFSLTRDFLEYPIFQDYQFKELIDDLFIKRSHLPNERFSTLFEDLKRSNPHAAAEIFRDFAEKTKDAVVFAYSALFHGKLNYFTEAIDLISTAFECSNAKARSRIIFDRKGQVLLGQMKFWNKKSQIKSIDKLEEVAEEAIDSFTKARNPKYASPLMGEVKVWIECIEWIAKHECDGDTDKTFEFITSKAPRFFHSCISNSLYLLDIVDSIVQKEPHIPEPAETQNQANQLRVSLLKTFNKGKEPGKKKKDRNIIPACTALCSTDKFPNCSQDELKRLQVYFILGSVDQQIELLKKEEVHFLINLLEDLISNTQASGFKVARHLMKVSLHVSGPNQFSLDKGLRVGVLWSQESRYDPLPYFYQMMINFLKILDGNFVTCRDSYHRALEACRENSKNHIQGSFSTHFLKKIGEGMNRIMTRSTLLDGEPGYRQNLVDFWTTQSRKKLLECSGRIRQRQGKSKQVYIELLQGNIELYVKKSSDFGKVDRNFVPGTIVYFVVSFNLKGPVANGITFQKGT